MPQLVPDRRSRSGALCTAHHRQHRHQPGQTTGDPADRPDGIAPDRPAPSDDPLLRHVLMDGLRALPPRQRAVVVLRYWEDLTENQTAEILGCSTGTVKSQTAKAMARLRTLLDGEGGQCWNMTSRRP